MSDLPPDDDDDTTGWPDAADDEPEPERPRHKGDSIFAGNHPDEPDVPERPHPAA